MDPFPSKRILTGPRGPPSSRGQALRMIDEAKVAQQEKQRRRDEEARLQRCSGLLAAAWVDDDDVFAGQIHQEFQGIFDIVHVFFQMIQTIAGWW